MSNGFACMKLRRSPRAILKWITGQAAELLLLASLTSGGSTCLCLPASAMTYTSLTAPDGTQAILATGTVEEEEDSRFTAAAARSNASILFIESPGGNLLAGLQLAQDV